MVLYLDCNATTPLDPEVGTLMAELYAQECGNAGSPHRAGRAAKDRVHAARDQIATACGARRHEVIFTSGATESNNLAILGLAPHLAAGKRHLVTTAIEHHAVSEPMAEMERRGFEVTRVRPGPSGQVAADELLAAVRPETLLVSVMHVNNETGVVQPIGQIADGLARGLHGNETFLHVDAAQGFGKELTALCHPRIDFISASSHKIFGPAGIGALIVRRPRDRAIPLAPIIHGGGQEIGLRSGTLPVPLIAGFGLAVAKAIGEQATRQQRCRAIRDQILRGLAPLEPVYHGDMKLALPHVLYASFPGWDAEEVIEAWDDLAAVSTGSACTSVCATASHVLAAMGVRGNLLDGAVRLSWCHQTDTAELERVLPLMTARLRNATPG